jgi:hypothetical protein
MKIAQNSPKTEITHYIPQKKGKKRTWGYPAQFLGIQLGYSQARIQLNGTKGIITMKIAFVKKVSGNEMAVPHVCDLVLTKKGKELFKSLKKRRIHHGKEEGSKESQAAGT